MPEMQDKAFGDLVYELRQARGWTLRDLAKASGISYGRLGEIERGVDSHSGKPFLPSYMAATRLARALGYPPADLLRRAGHEPGVELDPEEWGLVGIYRILAPDWRQRLLDAASTIVSEARDE